MIRALLFASAAIGTAILPLGAASAADYAKPYAQPFDWSGFYIGLHGGQLNGDVAIHEDSEREGGNITGLVWGGLAGYNFVHSPLDPWVLGVEADFGWADVHGRGGGFIEIICGDYRYDLASDAHFRVRAGFPTGNLMPFVAGGLAVADLTITESCGGLDAGGLFTGGTVGAGLDFMLSPKATLRGEFLYDFYGTKHYSDFTANFTALTLRAALLWRLP
jgi:outer membrane immunogenic protein